ncbi:hypothetical protein [Cellulophaga baltica]|uniref:hypothetical protein n=1 Tax=Cellulophaga baltica TaxID=76594 RepID=UPI0015F62A8C|nr:hypothetical protein [Cellulophaga baltica]MBA6316921.1 hypothetical protein [Cellulophaga baltica]
MTETTNIELNYFKTIGHGYQWFLLYEFVIGDKTLFDKSDIEILKEIISSRILNKSLYHNEMDGIELELKGLGETPGRPYEFDKIEMSDFQFINSKTDFKNWITKFRTEGWVDDQDDAKFLMDRAEKELWSRTDLKNGVWYLTKENFEEDSDKLIEIHWIYLHFKTFIEIDRKNETIRTFDFGYD